MSDQPSLAERQARSMEDVLAALALTPAGSASVRVDGVDGENATDIGVGTADLFIGQSIKQPHNRVFGGQVLAQTLMAASLTIADEHPGRMPHSLHAYFMRPGNDTLPIRFMVERMRDGRSFSTRRVHAIQQGKPILSMTSSFQDPAGGLDHQVKVPPVAGPDGLISIAERFDGIDHPRAKHLAARPVEHRYVEGDISWQATGGPDAWQHVWVRALGTPQTDPYLRASLLAYLSDYTLLESVLRRHGKVWVDPGLRVASLDHAMWFHRPVDPWEWLLYDQDSPSAQGGRGLGVGRIFTQSGELAATVAQEGMVRVKDQAPR